MFGFVESLMKRDNMKKENISTFENGKRQKVENMQQMKMKNKRARGV